MNIRPFKRGKGFDLIALLVQESLSSSELAFRCGLSESTIHVYLANIPRWSDLRISRTFDREKLCMTYHINNWPKDEQP
tara:strand:+ start:151 stop:387 length:237 start_codon:yes stop_codon:yes gene_type:complete